MSARKPLHEQAEVPKLGTGVDDQMNMVGQETVAEAGSEVRPAVLPMWRGTNGSRSVQGKCRVRCGRVGTDDAANAAPRFVLFEPSLPPMHYAASLRVVSRLSGPIWGVIVYK